jgi:hypothetical protein
MYDPNQPRVPKHYRGGGRWTRGGYGLLSDLGLPRPPEDDDGDVRQTLADLPRYAWSRDPWKREQPVYDPGWSGQPPAQGPAAGGAAAVGSWSLLDWLRGGISAEEARGWDEYERLSEQNTADRHAAIIFRVGQFRRGRADVLEFDGVEVLTAEQLKKLCPKVDKVQDLMNAAAKAIRDKGNYYGAEFGRKVHYKLEELIEERPDLGLESELSFVIDGHKDVPRGTKGSVRPDVKEREKGEDETLCFYDGKTGDAQLARWYMHKVARYVLKTRDKAKRIVVIQVKPQE